MKGIYTRDCLETHGSQFDDWHKEAMDHFYGIVADQQNTYPCVLGRRGLLAGHLRFSFMEDPRESSSIANLATTLREYGRVSRDTGAYASLVVFFHTSAEMIETYSIPQYEELFWRVLNSLAEADLEEWPRGISSDPADHSWEFSFAGEPYFCFCSTPGHTIRRSRYFPMFMITFQPRWVFEEINDSTAFGRKMKSQIRQRLEQYDLISAHSDLKWYGQEGNHEWKQYFLRDDHTSLSVCPFSKKH